MMTMTMTGVLLYTKAQKNTEVWPKLFLPIIFITNSASELKCSCQILQNTILVKFRSILTLDPICSDSVGFFFSKKSASVGIGESFFNDITSMNT